MKGHDSDSTQLPPDRFEKQRYQKEGLVRPLYNLEALAQLLELNPHHRRAVKAKAADVVGRGWKFGGRDGIEEPSEEQWNRLDQWFRQASPGLPLGEMFKRVWIDYDATGQGYIEVTLGAVTNTPKTLHHMPAHTVRRHADFHRYAQIRGNKIRWFKAAGFDQDVDMHTGQIAPLGQIPPERRASAVIHLLDYSSRSDYYGIPDILPALGAVLGELHRRDYNIKFFENHAIPAYAVTVTGAELDDDVKEQIEDFFQRKVKGNPHSTLVLTAAGGKPGADVQFKFDKLAVEIREASFRLYRIDNRDEILTAHGVPPYRAGIATAGSLGQNVARETTEIYKASIVGPRQQMLEWFLNQFVVAPMGITDWEFRFEEIDTTDEDREASINQKYFNMAAMTPNQVLIARGEDPEDDAAMDAYYLSGRAITGPDAEMATAEITALMQSVKALHQELVTVIKGGRS